MTRARLRALILVAVLIGIGAFAFAELREPARLPPRADGQKPALLLLTSLPLVFGEDFSLQQNGSPALQALQRRYRVVTISVTDPGELAKGHLLLMAQAQAQPPEDLVALDDWVRGGGRLLLLADPMLEWPSKRPLGDRLRPPVMFADTGLLAHWGLRLDAPDERGPKEAAIDHYRVTTVSPGQLFGACAISADRIVARCSVGRGKLTIVADADLLNVESSSPNLSAVIKELAALE
jgi:hypothetical protein